MLRALALSVSLVFSVHSSAEERFPGYGTVESVTPVKPKPAASESASAGGSGPAKPALYRIRVRMDDGRTQTRIVSRPEVAKGERVLVTNAGDVVPE